MEGEGRAEKAEVGTAGKEGWEVRGMGVRKGRRGRDTGLEGGLGVDDGGEERQEGMRRED